MTSVPETEAARRRPGDPRSGDRRGLVAAVGIAGVLLFLGTIVGVLLVGLTWTEVVASYTLTNAVIGAGFLVCGLLIAWHRPGNALGWLFLICAIGHLLTAANTAPNYYGDINGWPTWLTGLMVGFFGGAWQIGIVGLFPLTLLLFPDGHYPTPRWRLLGWVIVGLTGLQIITSLLADDGAMAPSGTDSILSVGYVMPDWLYTALGIANLLTIVLVISSLVVRYRRGPELVRNQVLWLILAVMVLLVLNSQRWITGDGPILLLLTFILVPIAITVAVLRYQLLDIRLVVSRTLLYLLVSMIVIAVYVGLVAGVSLLLPQAADRGVAIASALVVAFGFNPLRVRLQRVIDRAFYGSRADPVATASGVGAHLESDSDLDAALDRAREALRLPALSLVQNGVPVASTGSFSSVSQRVSLPLTYSGEVVGELVVGLRRGETEIHPSDRAILALTATPLAIALYSAGLADQIQSSRAAIVSAREEERVRLHRDLHDGLGPVLSGAAFRADAVYNVLRTDPDRAQQLLAQVRAEIRQALDDVRRIVYGLRPLDLEELGLVAAVRERVGETRRGDGAPLVVELDAPDDLSGLSAAVEVAAYRITVEAVTNVARHSAAGSCRVRIHAEEWLTVEITDDGLGSSPGNLAPWTPGVGIRSIIDRAEELGGSASAVPTPVGGRVFATLPLG